MPPTQTPALPHPHTPTPAPALRRLDALVGVWQLSGRTSGSAEDDISGRSTFTWLAGGFFLQCAGEISVGHLRVASLELIGYDPASDTFPSKVYSNLSGEVSPYFWDVQGRVVTHWMATSKYTGALSLDGRTLTGGWRPTDGSLNPDATYDAVMTRLD